MQVSSSQFTYTHFYYDQSLRHKKEPWQIRQKKEIDFRLDELEKFSAAELKNGDVDELIASCISACIDSKDSMGLQRIAHTLFAGDKFLSKNEHLTVLAYLFCQETDDLETIGKVIQIAFTSWKEEFVTKNYEEQAEETEKSSFWQGFNDYNEKLERNSRVLVIAGAGLSHVVKFLKNDKESGYECNDYGRGMYATPVNLESVPKLMDYILFKKSIRSTPRSIKYATRTPLQHFDVPVVVGGIIKAKYLRPTNNSYEVVIPSGKGHKLKSIMFAILRPEIGQMPTISERTISEQYDPDLAERVIKIMEPYFEMLRNIF